MRIVWTLITRWPTIVKDRLIVKMKLNVFKIIQHVHLLCFACVRNVFLDHVVNSIAKVIVFRWISFSAIRSVHVCPSDNRQHRWKSVWRWSSFSSSWVWLMARSLSLPSKTRIHRNSARVFICSLHRSLQSSLLWYLLWSFVSSFFPNKERLPVDLF